MDICSGCELCSIEKGEHRLNYGDMSDDLFHNTLYYLILNIKLVILGKGIEDGKSKLGKSRVNCAQHWLSWTAYSEYVEQSRIKWSVPC